MSSIYLKLCLDLKVAPQTHNCKKFLGLYTGLEKLSYCKYFEQFFRKCKRVRLIKVFLNTHLYEIHFLALKQSKQIL